MEYFRTIDISTTEQKIHKYLTLSNLDKFSSEIFNLEDPHENEAQIGGIWGEFTLIRNKIKGGCRFALLECPNALCWTITTGYPPEPESIVVHLTINRLEKEPEFIEEIKEFLDDMCHNLKRFFNMDEPIEQA
ncbi:hypothetical protein J0654_06655 [Muricauda lutimaris]|uniref:Uncharacterized protein n=1 Tax=Flagellimonas profundi TaxID=2915620 RepID=A0ABS3FE28_9FLAO|nr:hypothetical protein [Allomuricauda profundi]